MYVMMHMWAAAYIIYLKCVYACLFIYLFIYCSIYSWQS